MSERMWVKICGVRDEATLDACIAAGADAVGVVLVPSPRQATLETAARLAAHARGRVELLGVFSRVDSAAVAACLGAGLDRAQGTPEPGLALDAVMPVLLDGPDLAARAEALSAPRLLVDGAAPGSGRSGDLARIAALARARPVILAGGLRPDTVAAAIRSVRPVGVDVSSGVERVRGDKDFELIEAFVTAARGAASPETP